MADYLFGGGGGGRRKPIREGPCELCGEHAELYFANVRPEYLGLEPTMEGEPDVAEMHLCRACGGDAERQMKRLGPGGDDSDITGGL